MQKTHSDAAVKSHSGFYLGAGFGTVDIEDFDNATGFELLGGYNFNQNFAIEASYVDFGNSNDNDLSELEISSDTLALSVVGKIPLGNNFELYGQLGYHMWDIGLSMGGFGSIGSIDGSDMFYGIGANYNLNNHIGFGVKYADYRLENSGDSTNISMLSAAFQYRF